MQEIMQAFPVQVTEAILVSWTIVNLRRMLCSWYPAFCSTSPSVSTHQEHSTTEGPQRQALIGPLHLTSTDSQTMVDQAGPHQAKLC